MVETTTLRRPFSWLKLLQLIGGLVCFGLLFNYRASVIASVTSGADTVDEAFVRQSFAITGIVGFPFIIVLLTAIAVCLGGDSLESTLLCFLLNFVGFGMYLTTGALIAHSADEYGATDAVKATAAMCIITSFFFLCDVVIYLLQKFKK